MAMKLVRKTAEHRIYQRGDNRYAVKDADRKPVNGDEKVRILAAEGLISVTLPAEQPVAEGSAVEPQEEAAETAASTASGEEEPAGEEAPAEEGAPQAATKEESPAEAAPVEESPAEEAPAEDAPANEDAAGGDEDKDK